MPDAPQRWTTPALPKIELHWRCWDDDEQVVYNAASGDTHVLDRLSAELLRRVSGEPASDEQLAGAIASAFGLTDDQALRQHVRQRLAEFHDLGLIEPAPQ